MVKTKNYHKKFKTASLKDLFITIFLSTRYTSWMSGELYRPVILGHDVISTSGLKDHLHINQETSSLDAGYRDLKDPFKPTIKNLAFFA